MNKGGFLRIVEASVSILIIAGVLFFLFNRQGFTSPPDYSERARNILEEIAKSPTLRESILNDNSNIQQDLDQFAEERIEENFLSYEIIVCEVDEACGKSSYTEGEVYSAERVISSTINDIGPKKIRLFIWQEDR